LRDVKLIALFAGLMALSALAFAITADNSARVVIAAGFNMIVGSYFNLLMSFSAKLFPASTRARATSVVTTVFSAISAVAPLAGLPLIAAGLDGVLLFAVAGCQIAVVALMLFVVRRVSDPNEARGAA
jgi:MFS family permease